MLKLWIFQIQENTIIDDAKNNLFNGVNINKYIFLSLSIAFSCMYSITMSTVKPIIDILPLYNSKRQNSPALDRKILYYNKGLFLTVNWSTSVYKTLS